MKYTRKFVVILLASLSVSSVFADEGMWTISGITPALMQKMKVTGLKLSADQIYNEKQASVKDAVMMFDNGCSGELVSENGLLFTNHHCGRDRVQQVSTEKNNYIRDGYWAKSQSEEIPIKGLTVKFLIKTLDVTEQATQMLKTKGIRKVSGELEKQYADTINGYSASLDGYSTGQYFVAIYQVFEDVRLVGVPPESIGNFGGETDNFEWPRQSADFSVFRVYANANNMPAKYSADNKPYKPKTFLPINISGVHDGDFALTIGFPFSTQRYINSYDLKEELDSKYRATILAKGKYIEVLKKEMDNDEAIRLKYSNKNFSAGNSFKLALGTVKLVNLSSAMVDKQKQEIEFQKWVAADVARKQKYGSCLPSLKKNYELEFPSKSAHALLSGALFGDASLFGIRAQNLVEELEANDKVKVTKGAENYLQWYKSFIKDYDSATDKKIMSAMLKLVRQELKKEYLPDFYATIATQYNGNIDKYLDDVYSKTIFSSPETVEKFFKNPDVSLKEDPLYTLGVGVFNKLTELKKQHNDIGDEIRKTTRIYKEGMREMEKGLLKYPDANFSMRLTYGTVCGASPRDGIVYKSKTTIKGIIEKEDTTNFEFYVWPKLKEMYAKKDYGRYGENGEMYTCFLTSTDITGGNSGSPVINSKGELSGIAFDGNWESLAGSIIYEPEKNRSVNVDIRYVLFIIDKYAGSNYIMKELTIK